MLTTQEKFPEVLVPVLAAAKVLPEVLVAHAADLARVVNPLDRHVMKFGMVRMVHIDGKYPAALERDLAHLSDSGKKLLSMVIVMPEIQIQTLLSFWGSPGSAASVFQHLVAQSQGGRSAGRGDCDGLLAGFADMFQQHQRSLLATLIGFITRPPVSRPDLLGLLRPTTIAAEHSAAFNCCSQCQCPKPQRQQHRRALRSVCIWRRDVAAGRSRAARRAHTGRGTGHDEQPHHASGRHYLPWPTRKALPPDPGKAVVLACGCGPQG